MTEEAVLVALQQVTSTLQAVSTEMAEHRKVLTDMRVEMAKIHERQQQHSEFKEFLLELKEAHEKLRLRIEALESRNDKQDGALGFATWVKEFGPWILSMLAVAFAYFTTRR